MSVAMTVATNGLNDYCVDTTFIDSLCLHEVMGILPNPLKENCECEECYAEYEGSKYGSQLCRYCRRTRALERIANVLEHWVGMQ
jgi:hypothetical protein